MIYLDNAATTQIFPEVLEKMQPYLVTEYGNAGALYGLGRRAAKAVEVARRQVADFLNCEPDNVIFTSGGTESNNLVLKGIKPYLAEKERKHIISSVSEHDSVIHALIGTHSPLKDKTSFLTKDGFYIDFLPVDTQGVVNATHIKKMIEESKVGLVSVMHTNNITGAINPVETIGEICRENEVLFHTDCVQAAGFHNLDVEEIGCDFLSISAHKIHAPKGVGALYVRNSSLISPLISGGEAQEFGLRGGTENVASIVGFGEACEISKKYRSQAHRTILGVKNKFIEELTIQLKNRRLNNLCHINSYEYDSKVVSLRFDNIDAQTLVVMLDSQDVCISAGSACQSHETKANRVLTAIGLTENEARQSVRISFSELNTEREAAEVARIITYCVEILKNAQNI